jgi:3'-phosphoadenosine 5'-phosphosulfate sulfotransferase (PAPS reductase)/FAD synthetase
MTAARQPPDAARHVVPVSGGKDSTAMALWLNDHEPRDYLYITTPTGNELPDWFAHMRTLAELLGKPIIPIIGGTLKGIIQEQQMIPNWRARFCTRMLKIDPFAGWLMEHTPATVYVGLRADEAEREGGDYRAVPNTTMRFPLREIGWHESDVRGYLEQRGVRIPERTDCAWCFFQTLGQWWVLWRDHHDLYLEAEAIEAERGHTFRSPGRDTWPAALTDLRTRFEAGQIPPRTVRQHDLFRGMQCRVCRS